MKKIVIGVLALIGAYVVYNSVKDTKVVKKATEIIEEGAEHIKDKKIDVKITAVSYNPQEPQINLDELDDEQFIAIFEWNRRKPQEEQIDDCDIAEQIRKRNIELKILTTKQGKLFFLTKNDKILKQIFPIRTEQVQVASI